jgi:MraZ protein
VVNGGDKPKQVMFIGEYQHAMDDKGRLAIPAKFRNELQKGAVVTRGLDRCLTIYTAEEWEKLATRLANLPMASANTRAFARFTLAGAMDVALDAQGRVVVPDYLREYAGLGKKAVLAGLYNRLEVWDTVKWEEFKSRTEIASSDIAEKLGELGV